MFRFWRKRIEPRFPAMTDMHCHVLPGIDDGARDVGHSLRLLEYMHSWGIKYVIPTPHHTEEVFENTHATVDAAMSALTQAAMGAHGGAVAGNASGPLPVLLAPSGEYRIDSYTERLMHQGQLRVLGGRKLLVENPFVEEPWGLDEIIYTIVQQGYEPILAHPERYTYYHSDMERYDALCQAGVSLQVNLLSLAGYYGAKIAAVAQRLIAADMVDYLATDLHHRRHAAAITQYLTSKPGDRLMRSLDDRLLNDQLLGDRAKRL